MPEIPKHIKEYIDAQDSLYWDKLNKLSLITPDNLNTRLGELWTQINDEVIARIARLEAIVAENWTNVNNMALTEVKTLQKTTGDDHKKVTDMHDEMHRAPSGILQRLGRLEAQIGR